MSWQISSPIFAQNDTLPARKKVALSKMLEGNLRLIAVPTIQNAPETSWNFGIGVSYYFNTDTQPDTLTPTRLSSVVFQSGYSLKRQLQLESRWQIFTKDERMLHRGMAGYSDFFDKFWGVGNNTATSNLSEVSFSRLQLQANVLWRVRPNVFAGVGYQYSRFWDINWLVSAPGFLPDMLPGSSQSRVSGIGPSVVFDFRDNPYSAKRGYFLDISALYYRSSFGSNFAYNEYFIDARKYFSISQKQVFAVQAVGNFLDGAVPFRELARLGGPQIMRGYFMGRFTDKNLIAAQAEYRYIIWKRLAGSVFASTGQVAPTLDRLNINQLKVAYGGGLRLLLNKKDNIYVRFDYALTSDGDTGFYIRLNDAF